MTLRSLHPDIRLRIAVGFVQRLLSIMLMPLLVIHLATLYGPVVAGILTLCVAAAGIAANFLGGHFADVHGRRPVTVIGELGATCAFGLLALANLRAGGPGPLPAGPPTGSPGAASCSGAHGAGGRGESCGTAHAERCRPLRSVVIM
ncbi:hypothetical protein [Streptomyces sp. NWU49]|uniref:hypothetical protein n=1 Tax=Streptomyces sp. NWU49 TaxID=2201153 RepID=UPI00215AD7AE|nr:hypothetical protein [Streptomyces sp. NWU49]